MSREQMELEELNHYDFATECSVNVIDGDDMEDDMEKFYRELFE